MNLWQDEQRESMKQFARLLRQGQANPGDWPEVNPGILLNDLVLRGIDFSRADLHHSSFRRSDLIGCNFAKADLEGVDFRGAKLLNTTWDYAILTEAKFEGAEFDSGVVDRFVSKVLSDRERYNLFRFAGTGRIEYQVGASPFKSLDVAVALDLLPSPVIMQIRSLMTVQVVSGEDEWVQL